jgi:hypothetical protein
MCIARRQVTSKTNQNDVISWNVKQIEMLE